MQKYKKEIFKYGVYKRGQDSFDLSRPQAEIMKRNFDRKVWANVPVVMGHPDMELLGNFPELILGRVKNLTLTEQGVEADFAVEDRTASLIDSSKIFDVSISFMTDFYDERTNERVGPVLLHLGLVLEPYLGDLEPFEKTEGAFAVESKEVVCFSKDGHEEKTQRANLTILKEKNMTEKNKEGEGQGTPNGGVNPSEKKSETISLTKAEFEALTKAQNQNIELSRRVEQMELEADRRDIEINLSKVILSDKNPTGKIPGKFSAEVEAFLSKISKDARVEFSRLIDSSIPNAGANLSHAKGFASRDGDATAFESRKEELAKAGKSKQETDKILLKEFPAEFAGSLPEQKNQKINL
jgi:hypothetical protein